MINYMIGYETKFKSQITVYIRMSKYPNILVHTSFHNVNWPCYVIFQVLVVMQGQQFHTELNHGL